MELKRRAVAALKRFDRLLELPRAAENLPRASVLIPLLLEDGELRVLMTVRSLNLKHHAGEVCFPGGKRDPSDRDEIHTALREAEEEIGLPSERLELVCRLFPVINQVGLLITPVVGFIEGPFTPRPNADEVSEVFTLPLVFFTRDAHHSLYPVASAFGPTHSFLYRQPGGAVQQIWGLTAALGITVAALALETTPEFTVGFDLSDPVAWFTNALTRRLSKL